MHRLHDFLTAYWTPPHAVKYFPSLGVSNSLVTVTPHVHSGGLGAEAACRTREPKNGTIRRVLHWGNSVRNICPEAWQTGTIRYRRGLNSYAVCLADSRLWRRHVHHLCRTEARPQLEEV